MPKHTRLRVIEEPVSRPSLVGRLMDALRSYWSGPITSNSPEIARLLGSGGPTSSGINVDHETALSHSAVWSAVTLVADDISSLPLFLYKRLPTGGKDKFEEHPLYRLLHDQPNPEMSTMDWRRSMQAYAMLWNRGYAEIERDGGDRPRALWPIEPWRVRPYRRTSGASLQYVVTNPSGGEVIFDARDIIHLRGLTINGIDAIDPIAKMRESISLALAAERFGGEFYGNGSTFGGVVTYPGNPNEETKKNNREALARRHQGVENAHKMLALYGDAKFTPLGVAPNAGQFLETRTFQIREVARWFKIPPHKLGDLADATFSNVEQMEIAYYTSCIRPWLCAWELELAHKLISPLERKQQFIKHALQGFLRADAQGRAEFYAKLSSIGAITPNEIRELEDLDPIEGGDTPFVALNTIPLNRVNEWLDAQIEAKKPPVVAPPPPTEPTVPKRDFDAVVEELALALRDAQQAKERRDIAHARLEALTVEHGERAVRIGALEKELAAERGLCALAKEDLDAEGMRRLDAEKALEYVERNRDELNHTIGALRGECGNAETERDIARGDLAVALASRKEYEEAVALDIAALEKQRDAALRAVTVAEENSEMLRGASKIYQSEYGVARREQIDAMQDVGRFMMAAEEAQAKRDAAEVHRAETLTELLEVQDRIIATQSALRTVLVDALDRLVTKECDRARKAQASPEKLRAWMGGFYPTHDEVTRAALRPIVRAWIAVNGSEDAPDAVLDRLVVAYVAESQAQLRVVADEHDSESMAPALERLLRKWETERAQTVADWLERAGRAA